MAEITNSASWVQPTGPAVIASQLPGPKPRRTLCEPRPAIDFSLMDDDQPEIIECEIRLHSGPPANGQTGPRPWAEWSQTVVGNPVTFRARAIAAKGAWNGPLSPGVEIAAPEALNDPYWTVFLPEGKGVPIVVGQIGHPLAIGETFTLPPDEPNVWQQGAVFDGTIVSD